MNHQNNNNPNQEDEATNPSKLNYNDNTQGKHPDIDNEGFQTASSAIPSIDNQATQGNTVPYVSVATEKVNILPVILSKVIPFLVILAVIGAGIYIYFFASKTVTITGENTYSIEFSTTVDKFVKNFNKEIEKSGETYDKIDLSSVERTSFESEEFTDAQSDFYGDKYKYVVLLSYDVMAQIVVTESDHIAELNFYTINIDAASEQKNVLAAYLKHATNVLIKEDLDQTDLNNAINEYTTVYSNPALGTVYPEAFMIYTDSYYVNVNDDAQVNIGGNLYLYQDVEDFSALTTDNVGLVEYYIVPYNKNAE